jgi:tRNA A-37 threonylcarbamoyl transferase component Bud32
MGVVYEVEDTVTHRRLALKTLRTSDPDLHYRLKREFRSLAGVHHQNLVRLHDLGVDGETVFFTMDLVSGSDFLTFNAAPASAGERRDRVRASLRQLARGLQALHDAGFVHRDIKPSNVLVEDSGRVVLVDFGLTAPIVDGETVTLTAEAAGTAAYIAPEMLESGAVARPEADWYGFGVLVFETLAGRRPFTGSDFEVMQQKNTAKAPSIAALVPGVPPDLATLCEQLLDRDPSRRCGSALRKLLAEASANPAHSFIRRKPLRGRELIGRDAELKLLESELDLARAGSCRVLLLRGDSGLGKSALVRSFLQTTTATHRACTLSGRCYQRELVPFRALDGVIDQLSSHWKRLPRADAMFLVPLEAEFLLRLFPVLGRVAALTDSASGTVRTLTEREALIRSMAALKETLQRLSRRRPLILWLDDVQWIDPDSVRLLESLTGGDDPISALIILTSRPTESPPVGLRHQDPLPRSAKTVDLTGLTDMSVRELIEFETGSHSAGVLELIVREACGSPFFALSLARQLGPTSSDAPLSVSQFLLRELNSLSSTARSLLDVASLAGKPLHPRVAAHTISEPRAAIDEALMELESANLTQACAGDFADHFEPYHDRIRELVLDQLDDKRRQQLHGALARALDAEPEPDHDACARHYREGALPQLAARHAQLAADRAIAEFGFLRAAACYRMCLELPSLDHQARAELHRKLAAALKNGGHGREAAEEYLRAAAYSNPDGRVECEQRAAEEFLRAGHTTRGLETLRSVLSHAELSYPKRTGAALATSLLRHAVNRATSIPRPRLENEQDLRTLRRIDVCSGVAHCVGFLDPIMTSYYQALHLQMALKAGEPSRLCRALSAQAIYAALGGKATGHCRGLISASQELAWHADERARGVAAYSEGVVAFMLGQWKSALELCDRGERTLRESCTGVQWELDTTMLYVLASLCNIGDFASARPRAQRHIEEAETRADLYALTILRAGSAHILRLAQDQAELVENEVASVMSGWPEAPFSIPRYWELSALTNVDLYLGDPERALARFDDWNRMIARSLPMRVQVTRIRVRHARARATLAVACKRRDNSLLESVEIDARALDAEKASWAQGLATALRAGAAAIRGDRPRCAALLELGERQLRNADMTLDATILASWRAQLVGGTEGARLAAESSDWMLGQGIRDPMRFGRALAPGRQALD